MIELTAAEIDFVSGAINAEKIATGAAILGGTLLAIAALPELTIATGIIAVGGALLGGGAAGWEVGSGLAEGGSGWADNADHELRD
jgi:hypothetical protein